MASSSITMSRPLSYLLTETDRLDAGVLTDRTHHHHTTPPHRLCATARHRLVFS
ncbi:MAG: hypothetical protein K8963_01665 [Proteobacteria bacterium]|nr:hypothetical protein [Pseudomonadota bacterium]